MKNSLKNISKLQKIANDQVLKRKNASKKYEVLAKKSIWHEDLGNWLAPN